MSTPLYIIYELLVRLRELNPQAGEFVSCKRHHLGATVKTTTGTLEIPDKLLMLQFNDPSLISAKEMAALAVELK